MSKRVPVRMCAGCRQRKARTELFRIVRSEQDGLCLDRSGKAQGRSAYLCRSQQCLKLAYKKHSLERSFKQSIPKDRLEALYGEMSEELAER